MSQTLSRKSEKANLLRAIQLAVACVAVLVAAAGQVQASIITNGSLTGPVGPAIVPTDWTTIAGTPDTNNITNNEGGLAPYDFPPDPSPDGGTWVGLLRNVEGGADEVFGQDVTGLTIGQSYTVSWYAGNFGARFGDGSNAIAAMIDSSEIGRGSVLSLSSNWVFESVSFVATATDHTLSFKSAEAVSSYLSIDGISMTASSVIPEPASLIVWSLLGGIGLIAGQRRRVA